VDIPAGSNHSVPPEILCLRMFGCTGLAWSSVCRTKIEMRCTYLPRSVGVQANFVLSVVHNSPVSAAVMSRMMLALLDNVRSREVHIF
jgi:hypothetical protein